MAALPVGLSIKTAFFTDVTSIMQKILSKKLQTRSSSSQWKSAWIHKKCCGEYKSVIVGCAVSRLYLPAVPALSYTGPSSRVTSQSQLCHTTKIHICYSSIQCRARPHCTDLSCQILGQSAQVHCTICTVWCIFTLHVQLNSLFCQILYSWTNALPMAGYHTWYF